MLYKLISYAHVSHYTKLNLDVYIEITLNFRYWTNNIIAA